MGTPLGERLLRVLYLSYDGALDPLGASQVLPYVEGLAGRGYTFDLISFEKPHRWSSEANVGHLRDRLKGLGVGWHPLPYHRRPPALATAYDLRTGLRRARALHQAEPFDLVHVRSYPCATIALSLKRKNGVPFVFDMRGFYPEERVDGRLWSDNGPLFTVAKRLEDEFLREAAVVVTLTQASVPVLRRRMDDLGSTARLEIVPTAVDLSRFVPSPRNDPPRVVYLGSVGTWYRMDVMATLAKHWIELSDTLVVDFVINGDPGAVREQIAGLPDGRVSVRSVSHAEVPNALAGALATFSVIDPAPSKIASAPTKVGESLAAGLPVLTNRGVGDVAHWVEQGGVGAVLEGFAPARCREAAGKLLSVAVEPGIRERCRGFAERFLSLDGALATYDSIYRSVSASTKVRVQ